MDSICWGSIVRDLEFGDFLLAGIASGVRSDVRGSAFGVDVVVAFIFHMKIMKALDNFIRVDLKRISVCGIRLHHTITS